MIELTLVYGVVTLFLFGIADALASIPAKRMSPVAVTLVIDSFISVIFGIIAFFLWDTYLWNKYTVLAMVGSMSGYFGFLLFIYSLKNGKVGVSTAIANAFPAFVTLFGVVVLHEYLSPVAIVAVLVTVFGVFGLSTKFSFSILFDRGISSRSRLYALGAMLLWGLQIIIADHAVNYLSPFQVTHIGTIMTLIIGLTIFSLSKETFSSLLLHRKTDLGIAALLGVIYFTGMLSLNTALQDGKLSVFAAIAGAAPFVSALFAYIFFKERLAGKEWFAIFLVVAGLVCLGIFE